MAEHLDPLSPDVDHEDIDEQKYTQKLLDTISRYEFFDIEKVFKFIPFYLEGPKVGYAFVKLQQIFQKIDSIIENKGPPLNPASHRIPKGITSDIPLLKADPWYYFSDIESLAGFRVRIEQLIEGNAGTPKREAIERIRYTDYSDRESREKMLSRILNSEKSQSIIELFDLGYLKERNNLLDGILEFIERERSKKNPLMLTDGLRQRKSRKQNVGTSTQKKAEDPVAKEQLQLVLPEWRDVTRLHQKIRHNLRGPHFVTVGEFLESTPTICIFLIICITTSLVFFLRDLYSSFSKTIIAETSNTNGTVGQNVLSFFSWYTAAISFHRKMRHSSVRFWFLVCQSISILLLITSCILIEWVPPVSTFLSSLASIVQGITTFLILCEFWNPTPKPLDSLD